MIDSVIENFRLGNLEKAENICKEIIQVQPRNADALHFLGLIYFQRKEYDVAIEYIKKALQFNPYFADAYNNLGIIYQNNGQLNEALVHYQKALQLNPDFVNAHYNLGTALQATGKLNEAVFYYQKAIALNPNTPEAYYHLGVISQIKGQPDEAIPFHQKAIELDPNLVMAHYMLGIIFQGKGQLDDAIYFYQKAIGLNPNYIDAYNNLGVAYQSQKQFEKAIMCFRKAIELNPKYAQAYNNLGNTLKDLSEWDEALESYIHAIKIKPHYVLAHYNMGNILGYQGRMDEAIAAYNRAIASDPNFVIARWARCISLLPIIYPDQSSIQFSRQRYTKELMQLLDTISLETPQDIAAAADAIGSHQPFLLACQGLNDRDLQKLYGDLVCRIMAKRYPQFSQRPAVPLCSDGEPLRIGIVSAYFHYHSIWKIPLRGWVENLDKDRFHIYGYYTGKIQDHVTEVAKRHCHRFIEDVYSFEELCQIIRNDNLHVLLYPEIGMDPMTLRLAALKLAPIQCTSLGHPDTSGLPTIDYYLSSDLMEPPDADEHYTEKLIRLPNLGFCYTPPDVPSVEVSRATFGLSQESVLYLCSHALFTYLPQYDEVFPRIAQEIDDCKFIFIAHQDKTSPVTEQFHVRIKRVFNRFNMNDEKYVVFLPQLNPKHYYAINCLSNIFLDSIGWSSNNSTFEAIACNLPVVTLPGELMRQRHCSGILTMMGLTMTIAPSVKEYIDIAVRLGRDPEWRYQISEKISAKKYHIYHDKACVTVFEEFLEKAAKARNTL